MKNLMLAVVMIPAITTPVSAMDFTAPEVPDSAQALMPVQTDSFGQGLIKILKEALFAMQPEIASAAGVCLSLVALVMLVSILRQMSEKSEKSIVIAGTVAVGVLLLRQSNTMIRLGAQTVRELSDYGKLLLPVLTAAMAAEGSAVSSAALYAGTVAFDAVLGSVISAVLVPMIYMYLTLAVANSATGEDMLKKIRDFINWAVTWFLKTILYIFTGYMGITGVVSGKADGAALKATKLTIAGMVPVVGGILSDASEAVIVSAGLMKNAVGVYGLLAVAAIWISPFLKIGLQYLLLKLTAAVCNVFDVKPLSGLIQGFSTAMGLLLGMTGAVCMLQLISTICFMKGIG